MSEQLSTFDGFLVKQPCKLLRILSDKARCCGFKFAMKRKKSCIELGQFTRGIQTRLRLNEFF